MIVVFMFRVFMMTLFIFLLLYGDDMLISTNHLNDVNKLKIILRNEFDMKHLSVVKEDS